MNDADYPALYRDMDAASLAAQQTYLRCIIGYSALMVVGASLGVYGIGSTAGAYLAALCFLGGIFLSILMQTKKYEGTWYRARAVAESVKTSTWRYMMRAEPFDDAPSIAPVRTSFSELLQRVLAEHTDLAADLGNAEGEQITDGMNARRATCLDERKAFYLEHRIDEQRTWYRGKAQANQRNGKMWFRILVAFHIIAIVLVLARVGWPEHATQWPTEMFVVAAGSILTWMQARRFRELSAAYSLAAHEIGVLRNGLDQVASEGQLSVFVADSENAFSREHTQWVARRDS